MIDAFDEGQVINLTLTKEGERLDKALAQELPEFSRTQCQRLIRDGRITVNGKIVKSSYRLEGGERISVSIPEVAASDLVAEAIPLDIRYEDQDIVVVNKPAGMVVHPSIGHERGTLVNALLAHYPDISGIGGEKRPGIVHRLDKETSGLIVVAKNDQALRTLQEQFKHRTVKKRYLALVEGYFRYKEVIIDGPIGRDPKNRRRMAVISGDTSASARDAKTHVKIIQHYRSALKEDYSYVECRPITGRTHQIRVHLAFAKYPVVGDLVYGRRRQHLELSRHFLHASKLTLELPSNGVVTAFHAPLPDELRSVLDRLVAVS